MNKQQHYKAALYCRLSVDDGSYGGSASVSIETQKIIVYRHNAKIATAPRFFFVFTLSDI